MIPLLCYNICKGKFGAVSVSLLTLTLCDKIHVQNVLPIMHNMDAHIGKASGKFATHEQFPSEATLLKREHIKTRATQRKNHAARATSS